MSRKHDMDGLAGTMISEIPLSARPEKAKKIPAKKQGWPDWPFWWMDGRSMEALREIASRLRDKTTTNRGINGEMTPVEKQMYDHITELHQNFGELHDAFQASLQIIDDNRPSQRLKRVLGRITGTWQVVILRLRNSTALVILGAVGAVGLVATILKSVIHYVGR